MRQSDVERLYDSHAAGVFRYLLALVSDEATARDLLQDVFVKLARNPGCLEGVNDAGGFLFRMARNAAIDWMRRSGAQRRKIDGLRRERGTVFAAAGDPDAVEFRERLVEALDQLPEDQRTAVYLKLWEGLTFAQIAAATGSPLNTVASRYRYGLDKLRARLRPLYDEING